MKLIDDSKPYSPDQLKEILNKLICLASQVDLTQQNLENQATFSAQQLKYREQFEQFEIPQPLLSVQFNANVYRGLNEGSSMLHVLASLGGNFQFYPNIKLAAFKSIIDFIVAQGADVNAQDSLGVTPLMLAASTLKHDRIQVMTPFLENKADSNRVDHNNNSALYYSLTAVPDGDDSRRICEESALLLIHHNAQITDKINTKFVHNPILHSLKLTQGHNGLVAKVQTLEEELTHLKAQFATALERIAQLEKMPTINLPSKKEEVATTSSRYTIFSV